MQKKLTTDADFMSRAVTLSRQGFPAPNPHVGCVIVRDGLVVGEGYHAYAGGPHAEAVALAQAADKARGATVYVTLEPCNHFGRTRPCSEALIEAQVARVVYAVSDPNPKACGGGARLRSSGIEAVHLATRAASLANEQFLAAYDRQRAFVCLKAAIGLDGRSALQNGESRWITGERARRAGHRLRAEMGCVLVGAGTLIKDDPFLTARIPGVRNQPEKLVLLDRPLESRSWRASNIQAIWWDGKSWLITSLADASPREGGEIEAIAAELFKAGISGVLVEGGAKTHSRFLANGCVDRIELFIAPRLLGHGPNWCTYDAFQPLSEAPHFEISKIRKLGEDVQVTACPRRA
ncbi:MAG: bifunctional diaminohydroxyphosphoribosylaminopyrimidine deaminase/5-amino-6-(5-phosphoribosylamino)uracil reductase RibD [Fimbriimonadaceae bacterium]